MNKRFRSILLYFILFGAMFLFGFIQNIRGVTYPLIKTEFNTSYEQQGMMVSLLGIGYVIFCLVGGILLGRFGVKKALISGFILLIAGITAVFYMPSFWTLAGSLFIVFAGFGMFEVGSNALAAQLFTTRTALMMSLLHFFFGAGAALSPRAAGVISAGIGWRYVYILSIPLVLVFLIPTLFAKFPSSAAAAETAATAPQEKTPRKPETKKLSFFFALKTPMVWLFASCLGLMVILEMCTPNWSGLYFQDVYNLDPTTSGAAFVSNFFIFFTVSRLVTGFVIEKTGYIRSLFISLFISIAILSTGFILGARGIYILPLLGFFVAVFWPTLLATAMVYFRKDAPVMTSAIIVISGTIVSFLNFLIGLVNRLAGPAWGYRSCLVYAVIIIIILAAITKRLKTPYNSGATGNAAGTTAGTAAGTAG